jgi:hypothetical protein
VQQAAPHKNGLPLSAIRMKSLLRRQKFLIDLGLKALQGVGASYNGNRSERGILWRKKYCGYVSWQRVLKDFQFKFT